MLAGFWNHQNTRIMELDRSTEVLQFRDEFVSRSLTVVIDVSLVGKAQYENMRWRCSICFSLFFVIFGGSGYQMTFFSERIDPYCAAKAVIKTITN